MAIYFVGEYPSLLESLKSKPLIDEQKNSLSTSMEEVDSELNGVTVLLSELSGNYSSELTDTFNALVTELMITYQTISEGLTNTLSTMDELSGNLGNFKTNDDSLETQNNSLNAESNRFVSQYETDENNNKVETQEYINWQNKISQLKSVVEEIREIVLDYKGKSDNNIDLIDQFNDSIVNIRLKMAAVAFAQDGLSLEEIRNLSISERENLIQKMIDAMTEKYNYYKNEYETWAEKIHTNVLNDPGIYALRSIFSIVNEAQSGKSRFISHSEVGEALELVEFLIACEQLKTDDGRSFIECVRAYGETGDFNGSGLGELYWKGGLFGGTIDAKSVENAYYSGEMEEWFEERLHGIIQNYKNDEKFAAEYEIPKNAREVCADVGCIYDDIKEWAFTFKENYDKAIEVGVAVNSMKEFKGHVKYDTYYLSSDYKEFNATAGNLSGFLNEIAGNEKLSSKAAYMTKSELEMFRYLYETGNESSALTFADSIKTSLTKREGVVKATRYYYELMNGNNSGLEAAWDHISAGGTGFGDGVVQFCDGIVDLVAPSKEISVNEYAQVAFIGMLTDGGSNYNKSLLAAYNIGNGVGKESIPLALGLINPHLGSAVKIASNTGNQLEKYFRADDGTTYWEAFCHAGLDTISTDGIETMASVIGLDQTPLGKLGVAAMKNIVSTGVDYCYDPESSGGDSLISVLTSCMKEQITGELTDIGKEWFSDYLQGVGWPEGWADTTAGLFEPAIKSASSAMLDSAEAMVNTAGNNYLNGTSDSVIMAGIDQFGESFDLGGAIKDVSKNIGSAASDEYLDTVAERTYGGSGLFD